MFRRSVQKSRRISNSEASDFSVKTISADDFLLALREFIEEHFRGAIVFERCEPESGFVEVSPEGFAYFLKLLLNEVYGSRLVRLSVRSLRENIIFELDYKGADINVSALIGIAEKSGFSLSSDSDGALSLTLRLHRSRSTVLYAISVEDLYKYINEMFFG